MSRLNAVMTFLLLSCCNPPVLSEEPDLQSTSYNFGNLDVIVGKKSINDTNLIYATCHYSSDKRLAACQLLIETDVFDDSKWRTFCDFELYSELPNGKLDILEIMPWGKDKAIFMWRDINQDNLTDTEVSINVVIWNNCESNVHKFKADNRDDNIPQIFIIPYDNSYDVAFLNREICKNMFCKVTVNLDGTASEQVGWFPNAGKVLALEPTDYDSKKLLIFAGEKHLNHGFVLAYFLHESGWKFLDSYRTGTDVGWSTDHGYISYFSNKWWAVSGANGHNLRSVFFAMPVHPTTYAVFTNLPNFQLLLLAGTAHPDGNYRILRISSTGECLYSFPIEELNQAHKPKVLIGKFLILKHREYCLSLFFSVDTNPGFYKFDKYCFFALDVPESWEESSM